MSDDYLWDKSGPPDPEVERLERLLSPLGHQAPPSPQPVRRGRSRRRGAWLIGGGLLAAAAVAALWIAGGASPRASSPPLAATGADGTASIAVQSSVLPRPTALASAPLIDCGVSAQGFQFETRGGAGVCGDGSVTAGRLPIGVWLETPVGVTATVGVADIGALEVAPGSKLRVARTGKDQHRLELTKGRISARVDAPPRLFVIDTPAATAVDLGCAYGLWIDERERAHLSVTSGAVSWESAARRVFVPAGAESIAVPQRGPGTPVAHDASAELRAAVALHDAGDAAALTQVLSLARAPDSVTLHTLLGEAGGRRGDAQRGARRSIAERMAALGLLPTSVDVAALEAGDASSLAKVRDHWLAQWFAEP